MVSFANVGHRGVTVCRRGRFWSLRVVQKCRKFINKPPRNLTDTRFFSLGCDCFFRSLSFAVKSTLENFIFMIFSAADLDALSDSEKRKYKNPPQKKPNGLPVSDPYCHQGKSREIKSRLAFKWARVSNRTLLSHYLLQQVCGAFSEGARSLQKGSRELNKNKRSSCQGGLRSSREWGYQAPPGCSSTFLKCLSWN